MLNFTRSVALLICSLPITFIHAIDVIIDVSLPVYCGDPTGTIQSTGIGLHPSTEIVLFPQPSARILEVSGFDPTELRELRVSSIDGRMILNQSLATDQRIFDLGSLQNGQYIAEFNSDQGPIARKPLLIIR